MLVVVLTLILYSHPVWASLLADAYRSSPTSSPLAFSAPLWLRYNDYAEGNRKLSGGGAVTGGGRGIRKRRRIECICMQNMKGEDEDMKNAMLNGVPRAAKRVYVCTNTWCTKAGSYATLGAFTGLGKSEEVYVQRVKCLGQCDKGPNVRTRLENGEWLEFNHVASVVAVAKILEEYLGVNVNQSAVECIRCNFHGNALLQKGNQSGALAWYDKALAAGWEPQEGILNVMQASAHLQIAERKREQLEKVMESAVNTIPSLQMMEYVRICMNSCPSTHYKMLDVLVKDCEEKYSLYQRCRFLFSLFRFSSYMACGKAIKATTLLPNYTKAWLRAGDTLAELRFPTSAAEHYEVAFTLDPSLVNVVSPAVDELRHNPD